MFADVFRMTRMIARRSPGDLINSVIPSRDRTPKFAIFKHSVCFFSEPILTNLREAHGENGGRGKICK